LRVVEVGGALRSLVSNIPPFVEKIVTTFQALEVMADAKHECNAWKIMVLKKSFVFSTMGVFDPSSCIFIDLHS
jgi:hypothetical protein